MGGGGTGTPVQAGSRLWGQIIPPTCEPLTLAEVKAHLRFDAPGFLEGLSAAQTIVSGSHAPVAAYGLLGVAVEVNGSQILVVLAAGICSGSGAIHAKLQDSPDGQIWTDWPGDGWDPITAANDQATYQLAYTGGQAYLRAVATVGAAACEFGIMIQQSAPQSDEDLLLQSLLAAARLEAEKYTQHQLITATWKIPLDSFPAGEFELPRAPVQAINALKYFDADGVEQTLATYQADLASVPARVAPPPGQRWPVTQAGRLNAVSIEFVCGFGDDPAAVPENIKSWIKLFLGALYENRELAIVANVTQALTQLTFLNGLLDDYRHKMVL